MTDLTTMLVSPKPRIFANADHPVQAWKDCWAMFLYQVPMMWKNKEEWIYYHRASKQMSCGTDVMVQQEFESLKSQGLSLCDDTEVNDKKVYCLIPHPKKKKMALRCDLTFHRYLGEEDEDGNAKGQGLCPLLWGIGVMGDGFTYMNVKITEVELSKDKVKIALDLINRKWTKDE